MSPPVRRADMRIVRERSSLSRRARRNVLMPRMKSNSGARKRFKVTGSGKLARKKAYKSHILTKKSAKRKRGLRESTLVDKTDAPRMKRLIQS